MGMQLGVLLYGRAVHRAIDLRVAALLASAAILAAVAGWVVRAGLSWRRLFGSPRRLTPALLTVVAPTMLFTLGAAYVVYVPLSYLAPELVRRLLLEQTFFRPTTVAGAIALFVIATVAAPLLEETVFRGLLLQRWARRWGTARGVVASSALFALGHGEWLGHFVMGAVLALLFLRTRTLWTPITAHAINNALVVVPICWSAIRGRQDTGRETLEQFRSSVEVGPLLLAASAVLFWLYLRRYWPGGLVRATLRGPIPYDVNGMTPPR